MVQEGEGQIRVVPLWVGWAMSRTEQLEGAGLARFPGWGRGRYAEGAGWAEVRAEWGEEKHPGGTAVSQVGGLTLNQEPKGTSDGPGRALTAVLGLK